MAVLISLKKISESCGCSHVSGKISGKSIQPSLKNSADKKRREKNRKNKETKNTTITIRSEDLKKASYSSKVILTSHGCRFLHNPDNTGDNAGCTLWRQYAVMAACRNNKSSQIFYIHGNSTKAREPPWNGLLFCVWNKNVNKDDTCTFFNKAP